MAERACATSSGRSDATSRNLKACWGFDCLYGINNEDANFWYDWSRTSGCPLYISYGSSTIHESVKLYFMKEGLATSKGARSNPEGPTVDSIDVEIGIPTGKYIDDVMGLDKLLLSTTPKPGQPQSQSSDFLDRSSRMSGAMRAGRPQTPRCGRCTTELPVTACSTN